MTAQGKRALIIGCGIAGPVLAMFLRRAGFRPVIHERRSDALAGGGGSFGLAPNGLDVLQTLGLADKVRSAGQPTERIAFLNHKGKQLGLNPEFTLLLNRGDLQRILVEGAQERGVEIEFGKLVTGVEQHGEQVRAVFDDGTYDEGDLLVGCDGLRSRVRGHVADVPEPTYTGIVDCGGFGKLPGRVKADGTLRMTFGLRGFFGYQALPDGEIFWFQNSPFPKEPDYRELREVPDAEWRARLIQVHKDDHEPIADIIASSGAIERYAIYEAPTVKVWRKGRVALIGDAAHAMGPHTGQGASMALEDAIELAKALRDHDDVGRAFDAYIATRRPRVEHVIEQTRRTGNQKSPGAVGRLLRDLVLPVFLKRGVAQTTALYDHHIDW